MYHNVSNTISIDYQLGFALIASGASIVCTVRATPFCMHKGASGNSRIPNASSCTKGRKKGAAGANYIYMEASKLFLEIYYSEIFSVIRNV